MPIQERARSLSRLMTSVERASVNLAARRFAVFAETSEGGVFSIFKYRYY